MRRTSVIGVIGVMVMVTTRLASGGRLSLRPLYPFIPPWLAPNRTWAWLGRRRPEAKLPTATRYAVVCVCVCAVVGGW